MALSTSTIEEQLGRNVVTATPLQGGDVAESFRVELDDDTLVFAKTHLNPPPDFFSTEALGLETLRAAQAVPVPEVLAVSDDPPLLVLEWIQESRATRPDDAEFGRSLAKLHGAGVEAFGRQDRRSTGSRGLPNDPCETWAEFYATQRLAPLVELAAAQVVLGAETLAGIETVAGRLTDLGGPTEPPARLHGDLWAGNRLVDTSGTSWLIDPAFHGGHREFDLAMMQLFGGFGPDCFAAYEEVSPLASGAEERVPLHQLAPLIVHAIKFGGSYVPAVEQVVSMYR